MKQLGSFSVSGKLPVASCMLVIIHLHAHNRMHSCTHLLVKLHATLSIGVCRHAHC